MSNIERLGTARIAFRHQGDFAAAHAACAWLAERGFSVGSMQGSAPRAIWHGDCMVAKWRNLSAREQRDAHALMTGEQRNGPVYIELMAGATLAAFDAFQLEEA